MMESLKLYSATKYGRPAKEVEREIDERMSGHREEVVRPPERVRPPEEVIEPSEEAIASVEDRMSLRSSVRDASAQGLPSQSPVVRGTSDDVVTAAQVRTPSNESQQPEQHDEVEILSVSPVSSTPSMPSTPPTPSTPEDSTRLDLRRPNGEVNAINVQRPLVGQQALQGDEGEEIIAIEEPEERHEDDDALKPGQIIKLR